MKVICYNGEKKDITTVQVGDVLMSAESKPITVKAVKKNRFSPYYRITNKKGESYEVSGESTLCLKYTGKKIMRDRPERKSFQVAWFDKKKVKLAYETFSYKDDDKTLVRKEAEIFVEELKDDRYLEIKAKDFLNLSKKYLDLLHGYQIGLEYQETELPIDPYFIGFWIGIIFIKLTFSGDGTSCTSCITSQDSTVLKYFAKNLGDIECYLQYYNKMCYRINGLKLKNGTKDNKFLTFLQTSNLLNNKHIPDIYKYNSRENRLKLLAGLLDSDGNYSEGSFEFSQKNEIVMNDVIELSRSLGFASKKRIKKTSWSHKGVKKIGTAFRINIGGHGIEEIPTLIPRKRARARLLDIDVSVSSIKVEEIDGENEFVELKFRGDEKFLLDNFLVRK